MSSWRRPKWTTGTRHRSSSWNLEVRPFCLLLSGHTSTRKCTAAIRQGICWITVYSKGKNENLLVLAFLCIEVLQASNDLRKRFQLNWIETWVNKEFMIIFEWTIHDADGRTVKIQIWESDHVEWSCDHALGHFCCVLVTWSCLVPSEKFVIYDWHQML